MHTEPIVLDRQRARELWRDYRKHQHWSEPIDQDVMRTYQAIAQGKVVIRALASITAAGLNEQGLPKLAIVRADAEWCCLQLRSDGSASYATDSAALWQARSRQRVDLVAGSFPAALPHHAKALAPQIPLPLRPKRALAAYHVLFEAVWTLAPPTDPLLLRRVGRTDLWIVCAAWDLTAVEQAALAARLHA